MDGRLRRHGLSVDPAAAASKGRARLIPGGGVRYDEVMSVDTETPPPPRWLVRLAVVSVWLAVLALLALIWKRWGLLVVLGSDFVKYCF